MSRTKYPQTAGATQIKIFKLQDESAEIATRRDKIEDQLSHKGLEIEDMEKHLHSLNASKADIEKGCKDFLDREQAKLDAMRAAINGDS